LSACGAMIAVKHVSRVCPRGQRSPWAWRSNVTTSVSSVAPRVELCA
jgi:hypothetical protein